MPIPDGKGDGPGGLVTYEDHQTSGVAARLFYPIPTFEQVVTTC
jgi:hypothetical protein